MLSDVIDIVRLLRESEAYLAERGVPNARRNAEWLLGHVLGCRSTDLYLAPYRVIDRGERDRFEDMLRRRGEREPLQYILESTEFMSLSFRMRRGVFIPRPETELLVEAAEALLGGIPRGDNGPGPLSALDLCCGSGVIGISLVVRRTDLECTAVDLDAEAVSLTRENAVENGVGDRVRCVEAGAAEFVRGAARTYHAILCNPPYVPAGDIDRLLPEVKDHEPRLALDGGADGLGFYREVIPLFPRIIVPGGIIALEIGDTQGRIVSKLAAAAGFEDVAVRKDYRELDRVVTARRP
jgi:release factor glutamine methyltransferase